MTPMIGVSEETVKFFDTERDAPINVVGFSMLQFCPRAGEVVDLPGDHKEGAGLYEVIGVHHTFGEEESEGGIFAKCLFVRVDVKPKRPVV